MENRNQLKNRKLQIGVFTSPQSGEVQFEKYIVDSVKSLDAFLKAFPKMKAFNFRNSALDSLSKGFTLILNDPHHLTGLNTYCFEKLKDSKPHPSDFIRVTAGCS